MPLDGYARFKRRRRSYVDLAGASFLIVLAALALAGVVGTGEFGFVATLFLLAGGAWEYLSEKQMNGRLRAVVDAERSTARECPAEPRCFRGAPLPAPHRPRADRPRRLRPGLAGPEGDDPVWEARWRGLSPAEQARIAAAARAGSLLASDEEIELAAGFARRDRRRRRPTRLIAAIDVPFGAVLVLGGLVAHAGIFVFFGTVFLLLGLFRLRRAHQVGRGLRETIARSRDY